MKKLLTTLLALCLLFSGSLFPAMGERSALDAAFDAGTLRLVPAETPVLSPESFEYAPELLAALGSDLSDEEPCWLSFSPAGNSGLFTRYGSVYAWMDGKCRPLSPCAARSCKDTFGNFEKAASYYTSAEKLLRLMRCDDVRYSPDGRYVAITSYQLTVLNAKYDLDPILIDLSTGEIIHAATFRNRPLEGFCAAAVTSCFSADGRYWYFMLIGSILSDFSLFRYELETGKTELCLYSPDQAFPGGFYTKTFKNQTFYPALCETADGSLLIIRDTISDDQPQGITRISDTGISWRRHLSVYHRLPVDDGVEMAIDAVLAPYGLAVADTEWSLTETDLPLASSLFRVHRLRFSAASGKGFVSPRAINYYGLGYALLLFDESELPGSPDRFWMIDAATQRSALLTAEQYKAAMYEPDGSDNPCPPYLFLHAACLSPDGRYALVYGSSEGVSGMYLLRLEDLALCPVAIEEKARLVPDGAELAQIHSLEWTDRALVISLTDRAFSAWRFDLQ